VGFIALVAAGSVGLIGPAHLFGPFLQAHCPLNEDVVKHRLATLKRESHAAYIDLLEVIVRKGERHIETHRLVDGTLAVYQQFGQ
jgi:hypothetical protein